MTEQTGTIIPDLKPTDVIPDDIRAAIHAGHVGEVVIFCDTGCGREFIAYFTGQTREIRFAAARKHLADKEDWKITDGQDLCPVCSHPTQPDGISEQTEDLPDPQAAARRVDAYLRQAGDGLYDVQDRQPLFARDLAALVAVVGVTAGEAQVDGFAAIDQQVTLLKNQIADLRAQGARAAADDGMSGAEILGWLTQHGAAEDDARHLCVEIIRERRAARVKP